MRTVNFCMAGSCPHYDSKNARGLEAMNVPSRDTLPRCNHAYTGKGAMRHIPSQKIERRKELMALNIFLISYFLQENF